MSTLPAANPDAALPVLPNLSALPRENTFPESDWRVLAQFWHPVAFSTDVASQPFAARLLDERLVLYRVSNGTLVAAKDICFHRGAPNEPWPRGRRRDRLRLSWPAL